MFDIVKQESGAPNVAEWVSIGCKGETRFRIPGFRGRSYPLPQKEKPTPKEGISYLLPLSYSSSSRLAYFLSFSQTLVLRLEVFSSVPKGLVAAESWQFLTLGKRKMLWLVLKRKSVD